MGLLRRFLYIVKARKLERYPRLMLRFSGMFSISYGTGITYAKNYRSWCLKYNRETMRTYFRSYNAYCGNFMDYDKINIYSLGLL